MRSLPLLTLLLVSSPAYAEPGSPLQAKTKDKVSEVSFQREVRPLLSEYCFACHGPDAKQRKADLRLDTPEGFQAGVIVPGKPGESDLLARMVHADASKIMPPPKFGKKPTQAQIAKIEAWIAQGAKFETHWAFNKVKRPAVPQAHNAAWNQNPIDRFLWDKLSRAGLEPSPRAPMSTLARRLSLDLLGLPPSLDDLARLEKAAKTPGADAELKQYIERLFQNPHHGERLALDWLDAARFADTHGYHLDTARDMTRWREWVIKAFQQDLPFDRFTIEQLAGDLLPNATIDQKIASGFNRNHMITFEGGAIPEEYLTNYILDRVNTTGTVWLGMSVACAQCHDHKYDPLTMKDYYGLYAFFNRLPESGIGAVGNSAPLLELPDPEQMQRLAAKDQQIQALEARLKSLESKTREENETWLQAQAKKSIPLWKPLNDPKGTSLGGSDLTLEKDGAFVVVGPNPAQDTHQVEWTESGPITGIWVEFLPGKGNRNLGRSPNGNMVLTRVEVELVDRQGKTQPIEIKGAAASHSQNDYPAENLVKKEGKGWGIYPQVKQKHDLVLELATPLAAQNDRRIRVKLGYQSPYGQHSAARFQVKTTTGENPLALLDFPRELGNQPDWAAKINDEQKKRVFAWRLKHLPGEGGVIQSQIEALKKEKTVLSRAFPTTMVMQDMPKPRDTFILVRGAYDKKGEKVEAQTPGFLPPLPEGAPKNRLGLAQWLVHRDHPLTARVFVNRVWQNLMGMGLVRTSEDFGSQGEQPTHPELLDWLAAEFMEPTHPAMGGKPWSVRGLIRLIVTSEAYRQSSAVSQRSLAADPENRLWGRASRLRLPAEIIRDQALAASGLLDERIGGASVNPYQPPGLWE